MTVIPESFVQLSTPAPPVAKFSPLKTGVFLTAIIFTAEIVVMAILYFVKFPSYLLTSLLDGMMMIVLILPALYFLQLKPVLDQVEKRAQIEKALFKNEQLLGTVLEQLPVGVWIIDREGKIVHGNQASQTIWGGARYVGLEGYREYKGWWPESGEPIAAEQWAAARAMKSAEVIFEEEIEIESFDGVRKIILNSAVPIVDDQGQVTGVIVVNQDISARKKMEYDLQQSEELFRTAVQNLPVGVWLADAAGEIIYGNPAGQQIWAGARYIGIDQFGEYRGWWVNTGLPIEPDEWGIARAIHQRETSINEEIEIECFDGTHKIILNSAIPLFDLHQNITGAFVVNQDITERKRAEENLALQNQKLVNLSLAEHRQRELAEGLVRALLMVNTSLELEKVLYSILEQIRKTIPFHGAKIILLDEQTLFVASILGYENYPDSIPASQTPISVDAHPLLNQVFTTLQPVKIDFTVGHPVWTENPAMAWVRSFISVPLLISGKPIGMINLDSDQPQAFSQEAVDQLLAFATPAALAIHNARLFKAESAARQAAETLSAAAQALAKSLDLEQVIATLLDHIQMIVSSDTAGVTLLEDEIHLANRSVRGYGRWSRAELVPAFPLEGVTDSVIQRLKTSPKSLVVPNCAELSTRPGEQSVEVICRWLIVPIFASGKIIGLVELGRAEAEPFIREQIQWVEALVGQAAVSIQNASLFEEVRSSRERLQVLARSLVEIQENERFHIARELHDDAGQALSLLKLSLGSLEQDPECTPGIRQGLDELKGVADGVLEALHQMAVNLRPIALDHLGLVAALEQLAKNMSSTNLSIQFKPLGFQGERLPGDLEVSLYRIAQEALTNIIRHARASRVGILLERHAGQVKLFVEDNGIGFNLDQANQNERIGLVGMRERAEMFGGKLTIETHPQVGTSVIVEVPDVDPNCDR